MTNIVVVTGGCISGIGKGITASSIGLLLKNYGLSVTAIKIDPYINLDAGTMSPYEHGECYVLDDKSECDLDLGNYERFLNIELTKDHNITTGKIYQTVINKERMGGYLGKTVQIVPHITDEIQDWISRVSILPVDKNNTKVPDVCIIEVGGTVGDIETAIFMEALRNMQSNYDNNTKNKFFFVHVGMIIDNGELKTKPIQESVIKLRSLGIVPDMLVLRTKELLPDEITQKLKTFCHVDQKNIISNIDVKNIYYVPDVFKKQNVCEQIIKKFGLENNINNLANLDNLKKYYNILNHFEKTTNIKKTIGICGKYVGSPDTYLSLIRAIEHASFKTGVEPIIRWINTETFNATNTTNATNTINCDCLIIPGGFGSRGINGKLQIVKYARENNIPILGICLGMQIMVVDCWNALNNYSELKQGVSTEWFESVKQLTDQRTDKLDELYNSNNNYYKIVDILPNQTGLIGGTMRLGSYTTNLMVGSKVFTIYNTTVINERHRHRYEVNNQYVSELEEFGLKFTGISNIDNNNNRKLMEIVELNNHPYYIGCQFHPEYKSRYNNPHPLFVGLLQSTL
jgi:CTP synthase